MRRGALLVLAGLFVGVLYGKIATIYHLHLPPNWLARLTGADGETAEELAYYSLFLDAAAVGVLVSALSSLRGPMRKFPMLRHIDRR